MNKKNTDYGSSFEESRISGWSRPYKRQIQTTGNLTKNENNVLESKLDTLLAVWLEGQV